MPIKPELDRPATDNDAVRTEKRRELDHLLGELRSHAKLVALLEYLGERALEEPTAHSDAYEICAHIGYKPQRGKNSNEDGWIRGLVNNLRDCRLPLYQARADLRNSRYVIHLPKIEEQEDHLSGSPYMLVFKPGRCSAPNAAGGQGWRQSACPSLWQRMVHALPVNDVYLVFDTPGVVLGEQYLPNDGAWSGSGEVAAALLVGECLGQIEPRLPTIQRRWKSAPMEELAKEDRCLIILGSSIRNEKLQRIRERDEWQARQVFQFELTDDGRERVCIIRRDGDPNKESPYLSTPATKKSPELEYALVTFIRDEINKQTVIALQGITTAGTLAAVQALCCSDFMPYLKKAFEAANVQIPEEMMSFELLLRVQVDDAYPYKKVVHELLVHESSRAPAPPNTEDVSTTS